MYYDPGRGPWVYVGQVMLGPPQFEKCNGEVSPSFEMEWVDGPHRRLVSPMGLWRRWRANRRAETETDWLT